MSEKMGMVGYGGHEDYVFLGRDLSRARDYSEATAEQIDRERRKLVDDAYGRTTDPDGITQQARSNRQSITRIRNPRRRANPRSDWPHYYGKVVVDARLSSYLARCHSNGGIFVARPPR
ncbi:MAG: hypothetical protein H0X34_02460 [Chthoniobacterales bacterium]|nr:hypothetical protein [Chthoniobacterales bacterium]